MQCVVIPATRAGSHEACAQQKALLCLPQRSCFLDFFTNSIGVPLAAPLPGAIFKLPVALFRCSTKQGSELFCRSCRVGKDEGNCF